MRAKGWRKGLVNVGVENLAYVERSKGVSD